VYVKLNLAYHVTEWLLFVLYREVNSSWCHCRCIYVARSFRCWYEV